MTTNPEPSSPFDEGMILKGFSVEITEVDPNTLEVMPEQVSLSIAQDLGENMVFIALTTGTPMENFTSTAGFGKSDDVQRAFTISLIDWALFNAALQNQVREQLLRKMGLSSTATPEQALKTLLDGMEEAD